MPRPASRTPPSAENLLSLAEAPPFSAPSSRICVNIYASDSAEFATPVIYVPPIILDNFISRYKNICCHELHALFICLDIDLCTNLYIYLYIIMLTVYFYTRMSAPPLSLALSYLSHYLFFYFPIYVSLVIRMSTSVSTLSFYLSKSHRFLSSTIHHSFLLCLSLFLLSLQSFSPREVTSTHLSLIRSI